MRYLCFRCPYRYRTLFSGSSPYEKTFVVTWGEVENATTLHFPLFPSIITSLAKERIDLIQMIIMIAMLSVIFGLTGTYAFCKSGSMIEFFGGNKKTRKMRIIRILISVVIGGCSAMMSRTISMVMLHLIVLFLFFDVVAFVLRLFLLPQKRERSISGSS